MRPSLLHIGGMSEKSPEPHKDERLTDRGVQSWHAAEMDRAEEFFRAAMAEAKDLNTPESGSVLQWIAKVHMERGKLEQARSAFIEALGNATAAGDRAAEAVILLNYASLLKTVGETPEALAMYYRASELASELNNHRAHAHALGNIANVLRAQGEQEKALELRERALELLTEHGTARDMGNSLSNMGGLLRSLGRLRDSEAAYKRAIDYLEQAGATRSLVITHTNLAGLHMDANRLDDAADLLTSAISVAEANELPLQQSAASLQMARLELKRGDADAAFELADETLDPRLPAAHQKAKDAQLHEFALEALCLLASMALDEADTEEAARLLELRPEVSHESQVYARYALPVELGLAKAMRDPGVGRLIVAANEKLRRWQMEGDRETAARIRTAIDE